MCVYRKHSYNRVNWKLNIELNDGFTVHFIYTIKHIACRLKRVKRDGKKDGNCANDSNRWHKNKFKIENPISTAINVHHDIKPIKWTIDKLSPKCIYYILHIHIEIWWKEREKTTTTIQQYRKQRKKKKERKKVFTLAFVQ